MTRGVRYILTAIIVLAGVAETARAEWGEHYILGLGWTNKYKAVARCPGGAPRPWNPLVAVPFHSSLGQTGPRRMLLWPPTLKSPLYNNTPGLVPIPPEYRRQKGICPYTVGPAPNGAFATGDMPCLEDTALPVEQVQPPMVESRLLPQ
jgi:hypothetical protein